MFRRLLPLLLAILCFGCAGTERVDLRNDTETTVSFDVHDVDGAVATLAQSFLAAPRLGGTPEKPMVIALGRMDNDTCQHLDTDIILQRLGEAVAESDRFAVSAVFADRASNRDDTISDVRAVRGNAEFNRATLQKQGQLQAPELSLSGKLTQRNVRRDNGGTRIEYFVTLKATRLSDGVALWQKSCQVVKAVAPGMPVW